MQKSSSKPRTVCPKNSFEKKIHSTILKAKNYARKRGYSYLADDFAQEVYCSIARGWHQTFKQCFTDFLRKEFGRSTLPDGSIVATRRDLERPLERPSAGPGSSILSYADTLLCSTRDKDTSDFTFLRYLNLDIREEEIFRLLFIEEEKEAEIGKFLGVSEPRISQLKKQIQKKVKEAVVIDEIWDRYNYDENQSKLSVDWIAL